jgi:hypothetical protein
MTTLKFFWNGIKVNGGKLQTASYSTGRLIGYPEGTITIYAKSYRRFTAEVGEALHVQNDSDAMTDYFETDRIRVTPDHALYQMVLKAAQANEAHFDKMQAKRETARAARRVLVAA